MHALAPLRNKSLLMLGDSTDANVWARLCHCPRRRNKAGRTRQEENAALAAGACGARSDTHVSCLGVDYVFATCTFPALELQLHYAQAAYGVHPYGPIPQQPARFLPRCDGSLDDCYGKKWAEQNNERYGLGCMVRPEPAARALEQAKGPRARQPDLVMVNVNLWYWWRLKFYGKRGGGGGASRLDEWRLRGRRSFEANLTALVHSLRMRLPETALWALHTSVLPVSGHARVSLGQVAQTNAAIRAVARAAERDGAERGIAGRLALFDWEQILHLGWSRQSVLADDIHPRAPFNTAVGGVYLDALAAL